MCMMVAIERRVMPLLGLIMLALPVQGGSNLLENSPFSPPNVAGAVAEAAPLELRSILAAGGDYQFSLYEAAKKRSTWVSLNEAGHDFQIKAFDAATNTVTVEQQNRTYKLTLKEAKIIPLITAPGPAPAGGAGPAPVASGPAGPVPVAIQGPAGAAPALTPEQLRNLEASINRRRELRRQATAASTPAPPGQPPPPR